MIEPLVIAARKEPVCWVYVRAVMWLMRETSRSSPRSVVPSSDEWPGKDTRTMRQTLIGSKRAVDDSRDDVSNVDWPGKPLKAMRQTKLVFKTGTADTVKMGVCS
jgi:hypothetical protein